VWSEIVAAVALVLVLEGLLLSVGPGAWKQAARQLIELADGQLRTIGLAMLLFGALLLAIAR